MVGRLVPALSGAGILVFTYLLGEKAGKGMGIIAALFLFLSGHFQVLTSSMLGSSLNLLFLMASLYFLISEREAYAGVFFVLAGLARYSSYQMFVIILAYVVWKKRWKFFYGVGAMVPVLLGVFLMPNFVDYTILQMFTRNVLTTQKYAGFVSFLIIQKWLLLIAAMGGIAVLLKEERNEVIDLSGVAFASIFAIFLMPEIRYWYVFYAFPFLCILGAHFLRYIKEIKGEKVWKAVFAVFVFLMLGKFFAAVTYSDSPVAEEILGPVVYPGMFVYDLSSTRGSYMAMKYRTRIPPELVENNGIGLASGSSDPAEIVRILESDPPVYIIDYRQDERTTYWMSTEIKEFVDNNYEPHSEAIEENTGISLVVWERG